ncbi:MAG: hypothetical protein E7214_05120 [Clostridium sp.]|nr:hypothetical protein [Clostridium sp.]
MAHNKLYRNFIILQEDEKKSALSDEKSLSGYAKIEAKNEKCKISFYAQNLKKDDRYNIVLICYKKDIKQIVDLGSLKVSESGKGEASKEYYINNIAGLEFSYEKISGAAICKNISGQLSFLMYGFMNSESVKEDWKKCKIVKCGDKSDNKLESHIKEDKKKDKEICKEEYKECKKECKDKNEDKDCKECKKDCKDEYKKCKEDACEDKHYDKDDHKHDHEHEEHNHKHDHEHEEHDHKHDEKETKCHEDKDDGVLCKKPEKEKIINPGCNACNNISKFDDYEMIIEKSRTEEEIDPYDFQLRGAIGDFFNQIVKDFEEVKGKFKDIKYCKWFKVKIKNLDDMCNSSNYNKYTVAYYPMINYYPYIKKYGYFMIGYKCDSKGELKYIVYGIPGKKNQDEQPYSGKTGFVTWMNDNKDNGVGCWLMFYDYKNSTIVAPMK